MEVEEVVEKVRNALKNRPVSLDELIAITGYESPGGLGIALGSMEAVWEVGHMEDGRYAMRYMADKDAPKPVAYNQVLTALQESPGSFHNIHTRSGIHAQQEVGEILGWMYAEGLVEEGRDTDGRFCWILAS